MKFSITSFNPIAWLTKPPMSEKEIRLYDLTQHRSNLYLQLREIALENIDISHQLESVAAQIEYIKECW